MFLVNFGCCDESVSEGMEFFKAYRGPDNDKYELWEEGVTTKKTSKG